MSNDGEWSFKRPFVRFPSNSGTGSLDSLVNYRMKDAVAASSEFLIFLETPPPVDPDVITILPFYHFTPAAPLCDAKKKQKRTIDCFTEGCFFVFTPERTHSIRVFTVLANFCRSGA